MVFLPSKLVIVRTDDQPMRNIWGTTTTHHDIEAPMRMNEVFKRASDTVDEAMRIITIISQSVTLHDLRKSSEVFKARSRVQRSIKSICGQILISTENNFDVWNVPINTALTTKVCKR